MSLRTRLLLVTVGLVAAGLIVADVLTYRALARSLLQRADEQVVQAQGLAVAALRAEGQTWPYGPPQGPGPGVGPPAGSYTAIFDASGQVVASRTFEYGETAADPPTPALPADLPGSTGGGVGVAVFTAPATSGGGVFRVRANGPLPDRGTFVVAVPLDDMVTTLRRLLAIEAFVTIAVVALAGGLALWLVRVGLRPLEDIGATAGAIAAGDLSRRVEPAEERTEIGRLGLALNAMLAQIEAAFDERRTSEERLRRFVGDASHELRTPLTSIRGYAELFRRGAGERPEDLATTMARIEAEAERMGVLVDDLLLLARLDQGRPLGRDPVDLAAVVDDAIAAARAITPDRQTETEIARPATVTGDAGRLRQIVDNLLENARVHTPSGTPTRVEVRVEPDAVLLRIADRGPGMDPEVAAKAFERFYRGDPARARSTGGAGLGLAIVAAIVEAHGGTVRIVEAHPGTAVEVRLPRASATAVDPGAAPTRG